MAKTEQYPTSAKEAAALSQPPVSWVPGPAGRGPMPPQARINSTAIVCLVLGISLFLGGLCTGGTMWFGLWSMEELDRSMADTAPRLPEQPPTASHGQPGQAPVDPEYEKARQEVEKARQEMEQTRRQLKEQMGYAPAQFRAYTIMGFVGAFLGLVLLGVAVWSHYSRPR